MLDICDLWLYLLQDRVNEMEEFMYTGQMENFIHCPVSGALVSLTAEYLCYMYICKCIYIMYCMHVARPMYAYAHHVQTICDNMCASTHLKPLLLRV